MTTKATARQANAMDIRKATEFLFMGAIPCPANK